MYELPHYAEIACPNVLSPMPQLRLYSSHIILCFFRIRHYLINQKRHENTTRKIKTHLITAILRNVLETCIKKRLIIRNKPIIKL